MAQKTVVSLLDDLDGSEAVETLRFALDGASYEIDLNEPHAAALREALEQYAERARKLSKTGTALRRTVVAPGHDNHAVRDWAKSQGLKVGDKGRISADVLQAYDRRNDRQTAPQPHTGGHTAKVTPLFSEPSQDTIKAAPKRRPRTRKTGTET